MIPQLELRQQIEKHLTNDILPYWIDHTIDEEYGGFYGYITNDQQVNKEAEKGCILNSRILWSYSKAYQMFKDERYLKVANHAYSFLIESFIDPEQGGVYWMVDYKGHPVEDRKHIYNQSFAIYGLSEYYMATGNEESLEIAKELYELIEKYAYDQDNKGYLEAFTRTWGVDEDLRLSGKDLNSAKSMNTHLHILEAYTNLYRVWKDEGLKRQLTELIEVTLDHIVHPDTYQFILFFNEQWQPASNTISYGHDIEGSWLLYEAAEVLQNERLLERVENVSLKMAKKVLEDGIDSDGSVMNELEGNGHLDKDRVWWVQAESMVGFYNAFHLTKDPAYYNAVERLWQYITKYVIDHKSGEWYWKLDENNHVYHDFPKVEPWKCPYHNSRFCFEMIERINKEQG
ncbi:AGE family epimerase/isomerase [Halalkalibacter sp. APA_J-10(15)]|uniref:AGE family epimerase/isomerase n=1 Tax=Halalkalibacter sp. APA_J-10(15) TaxID=2933805 RepID=UPI001FF15FAB|nr:AGE family epimerase/isomerase [Halalkalibacter sp. APA_J-10(15)]MCK0471225.1 AGE family epimerase/isomerase [Halalkalibacter sp. APA_J-10(15)]